MIIRNVDAHIHFNKQPYSLEIVNHMVDEAIKHNITELHLLDHTHKFIEFDFLYDHDSLTPSDYERFHKHKLIPIKEYLDFTELVKKQKYPIRILFGLEVCYFPKKEKQLKNALKQYNFDFLIGSVHHVDGWAFDITKETWEDVDVDHVYKRYYEIMEQLIRSRLFTQLGHPDSIKIFDYYPTFDLHEYYKRIAKLLKKYNMPTEYNTGFVRFGFSNYGLNEDFLAELLKQEIDVYLCSDAHEYSYIGCKFDEIGQK